MCRLGTHKNNTVALFETDNSNTLLLPLPVVQCKVYFTAADNQLNVNVTKFTMPVSHYNCVINGKIN